MPLPILVWVGAAAAAAVVAAVAMDDDESTVSSSSRAEQEREIEQEAERKRQTALDAEANAYSREKLKSFIDKYNLPHNKKKADLDRLINDIQNKNIGGPLGGLLGGVMSENLDAATIKNPMTQEFMDTPFIRELDKNIEKESNQLRLQKEADAYLCQLEECHD